MDSDRYRQALRTMDAEPVRRPRPLEVIATGVITVAALYFGREIFVPLAVAVLLSFALGPLVVLLRRLHVGRVPSVVVVVVAATLVVAGIASVVGSQLALLAEKLPQYQSNIIEKVHSVRSATVGQGIVGKVPDLLERLRNEVARPAPQKPKPAPQPAPADRGEAKPPPTPVPVEIHQPEPTTFEIIRTIVGPLLRPLAETGIVVVFVVFFLLQREDLRDRFIRLAGARDLQRTTQALDDAAHRLGRYLLAQAGLNALFGLLTGAGLWLIGVPNPVLWGILGMLLRFVPYIGPVMAAIFPVALAIAVAPGWSKPLWTVALYAVIEPLMGQAVEPFVYGRSTGLSAVAVVVAAAFWTWLWGPIGLFLSTPLTLCLVVLGRHVEQLEFLKIMFGDEPTLSREEHFYQRMLAEDPDEAAHHAEIFLKEKPLAEYYDTIAVGGLALAQIDVNRGALDPEWRQRIRDAVLEVVDDLADHAEAPDGADRGGGTTLCIAGRGALDEAVAAMLAQVVAERGLQGRVVPNDAVAVATIRSLDVSNVRAVCLSYLEHGGFSSACFLVRRLRRVLPHVPIIVGFWRLRPEYAQTPEVLEATGADLVVTSLRQAADRIAAIQPKSTQTYDPKAAPLH